MPHAFPLELGAKTHSEGAWRLGKRERVRSEIASGIPHGGVFQIFHPQTDVPFVVRRVVRKIEIRLRISWLLGIGQVVERSPVTIGIVCVDSPINVAAPLQLPDMLIT